MISNEHHVKADEFLTLAEDSGHETPYFIQKAQVHADLALLGSSSSPSPVVKETLYSGNTYIPGTQYTVQRYGNVYSFRFRGQNPAGGSDYSAPKNQILLKFPDVLNEVADNSYHTIFFSGTDPLGKATVYLHPQGIYAAETFTIKSGWGIDLNIVRIL